MGGTDYDDSNPAILYSAGWTAQTGTNSQQFMSTSHTTTVKGASATIKFQGAYSGSIPYISAHTQRFYPFQLSASQPRHPSHPLPNCPPRLWGRIHQLDARRRQQRLQHQAPSRRHDFLPGQLVRLGLAQHGHAHVRSLERGGRVAVRI